MQIEIFLAGFLQSVGGEMSKRKHVLTLKPHKFGQHNPSLEASDSVVAANSHA